MTLSDDVRWRVVKKRLNGVSERQTAKDLFVSPQKCKEFFELYVALGDVAHTPAIRMHKLNQRCRMILRSVVVRQPLLFLDEYVSEIQRREGLTVSLATMCRELHLLGLSRKIVTTISGLADPADQQRFVFAISQYRLDQLVWTDETGTNNQTLLRRRGWAPVGVECLCPHLLPKGSNFSTIGNAPVQQSLVAHSLYILLQLQSTPLVVFSDTPSRDLSTQCGWCTGQNTFWYMGNGTRERVDNITPFFVTAAAFPGPRSVLALDNNKTHYSDAFLRLVQISCLYIDNLIVCITQVLAKGVRIEFLSAYSPMYMPCEGSTALVYLA
jgi:transposase